MLDPETQLLRQRAEKLIDEIEDGDASFCTDETIDLLLALCEKLDAPILGRSIMVFQTEHPTPA